MNIELAIVLSLSLFWCVGLFTGVFISFLERRRLLNLIDQLTDKVMSRDYRDYVWGQETKKPDEPVVHRSRSDRAEFQIEQQNQKAEVLSKAAEKLGKKLKDMGKRPV
ncbi:MAG TPA: hypothetical protein ENI23_03140 [bacterium]|nr:hypothetical protein [bacterium]